MRSIMKAALHFLIGVPLAFGFIAIVTVGIAGVAIFCLLAPIAQGAYDDWRHR